VDQTEKEAFKYLWPKVKKMGLTIKETYHLVKNINQIYYDEVETAIDSKAAAKALREIMNNLRVQKAGISE
jgi:hypothetical protein